MELRHLRYFVALAECLNFTRAAERVHVTQSTLSHQIRQLEKAALRSGEPGVVRDEKNGPRFSVADAYLYTVLNWSRATSIDVARWSVIKAYLSNLRKRPSVAK